MLVLSWSIRPWQSSQMFVRKVRSLPTSGAPERCRESLPGTNSLISYEHLQITNVNFFITFDSGRLWNGRKAGYQTQDHPNEVRDTHRQNIVSHDNRHSL